MSYWDYKFYIIYLVFLNRDKKYLHMSKPIVPEREMLNCKMETRMDVRHFFEVVRMWKPMALRKKKNNKKDAQKRNIHKESEKRKTGSVYRIDKSSTIYTASFKTQMSSTI